MVGTDFQPAAFQPAPVQPPAFQPPASGSAPSGPGNNWTCWTGHSGARTGTRSTVNYRTTEEKSREKESRTPQTASLVRRWRGR